MTQVETTDPVDVIHVESRRFAGESAVFCLSRSEIANEAGVRHLSGRD
jgi:hypothetical protein